MAHTVTVTGKIGPNFANTAVVHPNVKSVQLDFAASVLRLVLDPPPVVAPATPVHPTNLLKNYDLTGMTSVVDTITAGQHVIVVS